MLLASVHQRAAVAVSPSGTPAPPATHLLWFCDGLVLFFLVPWICTDLLVLDNDFYYAIFIWVALTFLFYYQRITKSDVIVRLTIRWQSSVFLGLLVAAYLAVAVSRVNPTARPSGALLVFELVWRGVAYGVVKSLALTAFPLAVGVGLLGHVPIVNLWRRVQLGGIVIVLITVLSAAHHLGFQQFTPGDAQSPQLATAIVSVPTVATANPAGSIIAQSALHLVVTFRTFESDALVPPAVEYHPPYEPPGIFGPR